MFRPTKQWSCHESLLNLLEKMLRLHLNAYRYQFSFFPLKEFEFASRSAACIQWVPRVFEPSSFHLATSDNSNQTTTFALDFSNELSFSLEVRKIGIPL